MSKVAHFLSRIRRIFRNDRLSFGLVLIVLKRQQHYVSLTLLALLNIILAVGLITNAAFFTQAVDRVVLLEELESFTSVTGRPPFSTSVYVFPSTRNPVTVEKAEELSPHIRQVLSSEVGLPLRHAGLEISSGNLILQPAPGTDLFTQGQTNLGTVDAVVIENVSDQMRMIEGAPLDESKSSGAQMDIWMHESKAQEMGVRLGETLMIGRSLSGAKQTIRITGIWRAIDPKAEFWFNNPDSTYKNALLVRRSDYIRAIQPMLSSGSANVSWYVILDENRLVPAESRRYIEGYRRGLEVIQRFLPGARMNMPPLDPLEKFVQRSSAMTILLMGYNIPAFIILLYFLILTSTIMAQWQRRETGLLVSRGMNLRGVLSLTLTEQVLLFLVGYPLGMAFGMLVARWMGNTESFLSFTARPPLPVSLEGFNLPLTVLALGFALFSRLLPALHAARTSLVTEERERARPMHRPLWFRAYLDLLLLVPTMYAYDQMVKRGSLAGLVTDRPEDLYRDPLLVVVPALFILTASLVALRIFALLMRILDLLAGHVPWLALHLAVRQLGRQSLDYIRPLLLVVIALAMGIYTLAMAASLDQWTVDRIAYRTGANLVITPSPEDSTVEVADGSWIPLPQDFRAVPGVHAATRVGDFDMRVQPPGGGELRGRFLAVDRADFAAAAWFRDDFAGEPLGALMNRMAPVAESVLVSEDFLQKRGYQVGDILTIRVDIENLMSVSSEFIIAGAYRYFPTVYENEITFIGSLDAISLLTGITPAHQIWMRLTPGADSEAVRKDIQARLRIQPTQVRDMHVLVREEQERKERVGIFGTLTVSFLATAVMAVLGLLIYSYASLQERSYRLAVLNAVGLSRRQILAQVTLEYAFLALFGVLGGAIIGQTAAVLFVPFFRYTGEIGAPLPPLLPIVTGAPIRNLSLIFGSTIIIVEVVSMASILHNRLVQILKRVWM